MKRILSIILSGILLFTSMAYAVAADDMSPEEIQAREMELIPEEWIDDLSPDPVFDSYDAAYEDRYFHWYLILDEGKLHIVYVDDGRNGADITEDADRVPWRAYKILEFWKYLDEDGKLMIGDDAGERSVT